MSPLQNAWLFARAVLTLQTVVSCVVHVSTQWVLAIDSAQQLQQVLAAGYSGL